MISMFSGSCETAREKADAGDQEPRLGAGDGFLEVLGEAAVASEPSKGAFDDPAFGFGLECADPLGPGDNLDCPPAKFGDRVAQLVAAVDAIGEDVAQLREGCSQRGEQRHRAVIVLDVGRVHQHGEQKALRIGDHVALTPFDPLGNVKPAWAATFRGLGALAVDDASRGNGVASHRLAGAPYQREIDSSPNALVSPEVKVVLNGGARRKVLRQRPPLAAGRQNIKDGIHHRPQLNFSWASDAAGGRQEKREQKPFRIRHVACIAQMLAPILLAGDFGPRHCVLHRISQIRRNHKGLKSLTSFSAGLLEKDAPVPRAIGTVGDILCRPVLGGLHHQYVRI